MRRHNYWKLEHLIHKNNIDSCENYRNLRYERKWKEKNENGMKSRLVSWFGCLFCLSLSALSVGLLLPFRTNSKLWLIAMKYRTIQSWNDDSYTRIIYLYINMLETHTHTHIDTVSGYVYIYASERAREFQCMRWNIYYILIRFRTTERHIYIE